MIMYKSTGSLGARIRGSLALFGAFNRCSRKRLLILYTFHPSLLPRDSHKLPPSLLEMILGMMLLRTYIRYDNSVEAGKTLRPMEYRWPHGQNQEDEIRR